jgi:DNA-binding NarL/FixJ family response regulator
MPRLTDSIAINDPFLDRRTKLLPCQVERIFRLREEGMSINAIARTMGVSKRTVQFKLHPERREANVQRRQERGGWKQYHKPRRTYGNYTRAPQL